MVEKYESITANTQNKQKFFKGMSLQQYIRGVNQFYESLSTYKEFTFRGGEVKQTPLRKKRVKTQLDAYSNSVSISQSQTKSNSCFRSKQQTVQVKIAKQKGITPIRQSKIEFPKLMLQKEMIKLEQNEPIHSKMHNLRPHKRNNNSRSLRQKQKLKYNGLVTSNSQLTSQSIIYKPKNSITQNLSSKFELNHNLIQISKAKHTKIPTTHTYLSNLQTMKATLESLEQRSH